MEAVSGSGKIPTSLEVYPIALEFPDVLLQAPFFPLR
jgi:hypothetical protein